MALDLSNDYLFFDNPETVTVTFMRAAGNTTQSVAGCTNCALSKTESARSGIMASVDVRQRSLPATNVGLGNVIQVGDTVTDSGGVIHTVLTAELRTLNTRWHVVTRKEVS